MPLNDNLSKSIGVIYEITNNPYFGSQNNKYEDRLSEFAKPSEVNELVKAINNLGYDVEIIDGPNDLLNRIDYILHKCFIIFNKSIGFKGLERKIVVPAICQLKHLPLLGSSAYSMTLARHKFHSNRLIAGLGFLTPNGCLVNLNSELTFHQADKLKFPVIVKPNHESDSLGIDEGSICKSLSEANSRIKFIHKFFEQAAIVEDFIGGEEWKVAVIGNYPKTKAMGCVGVKVNGEIIIGTLQTRNNVIEDNLTYYEPQKYNIIRLAMKTAIQLHDIFGLMDYSRQDFRLDNEDNLYCMEVSTHPDIDTASSFICAAKQSLGSYEKIIESIIDTSIRRINEKH